MNSITTVVVVAGGFLLFGLVSRRLSTTWLSGPMLFAAFGLALGPLGANAVSLGADHSVLHLLAEITLILVLFSDAAMIDLRQLRRDHNVPVRLLAIGLPLCIVLGALVATVVFPGFTLFEAFLLAAILAPTDAALGQAVVADERVPVRIRQSLSVESGLNDGIALPVVLVFVALASAMGEGADTGEWIRFGLLQVTLGPLAGAAIGYGAGKLVLWASSHDWLEGTTEGIVALAVAFLAFGVSEAVHGNGFIGAFIGGLAFGNCLGYRCKFLFEFAEAEGQILTLGTFFAFGVVMLPEALTHISVANLLYAALALTVLRMLPVFIALVGTGMRPVTALFIGWFGPRGLASVLFVLLILDEGIMGHSQDILIVTATTVALSILLHGATAVPAVRRYVASCEACPGAPELEPVPEVPFETD